MANFSISLKHMKTVKEESLFYWRYLNKHPNFTGCVIDANGDKAYYKNGLFHREDGPAIEHVDGNKWYFLNDKQYSYGPWLIMSMLLLHFSSLKLLFLLFLLLGCCFYFFKNM